MKSPVNIQKVLFATDFSEYSDRARDHVLFLAQKLGASAVVFHSIELVSSLEPDDPEMKKWYKNLEVKLRDKLDHELTLFREQRVAASGELSYGTPWKTVLAFSEQHAVDLIVVGSHGLRSQDGRLLLGTTSQKIALASRIPVLIVYAAG